MQTWIIGVDENEHNLRRAWELPDFRMVENDMIKSLDWPCTKTHIPYKTQLQSVGKTLSFLCYTRWYV
jgi:hypothetical protein